MPNLLGVSGESAVERHLIASSQPGQCRWLFPAVCAEDTLDSIKAATTHLATFGATGGWNLASTV